MNTYQGHSVRVYLQQHKPVLMCVAWGADRKDAVLHIGPSSFLVAARGQEAVCEVGGRPAFSAGVAALGRLLWGFKKPARLRRKNGSCWLGG
jgi:hypothetical protein